MLPPIAPSTPKAVERRLISCTKLTVQAILFDGRRIIHHRWHFVKVDATKGISHDIEVAGM